ncbi:flavodoxin domain-containing protein [Desulfobotulus sp. H1]|uniref:Flavodoxin domain-containing protein n=1 Tax=Desulfobotulus pelophilus TaxID=2823377 RepID=A0ABT3N6T7_9BACT|nr:flavodoxin domain-containing protein [Desulfobotulus pelophilus]MCW7753173.1 flavodoxin domain-containing protein [Desulfobotulus pelophilus]
MRPVEIAPNIFEVGVRDWNIRDFHGYSTPAGTTYNAFLIRGETNVLIDTVKAEFTEELLANIRAVMDPKDIDIVVSNHTEMDHSGGLPRVMSVVGEDKPLYCSKMGAKNLARHFHQKWNLKEVGSGEELAIGSGRTLMFLETRMLHWPDSMFTYLKEEGILFSSDAFGQHYAGSEVFDDQMDISELLFHAKKYYANILLPFSSLITKLLKSVGDMGLRLNMVCPDHGILWRKDPAVILEAYERWSRQETLDKAVVIYDTMWHSTEMMADAIVSGLVEAGVTQVRPISVRKSHRSDIMTEIMDAKAVLVGSPTLNNQIFPALMDVLTYMKGLKPQGKIAAAFGSYGWSGEAVKLLNAELASMGFELPEEGIRVQYVPEHDQLTLCHGLGRRIGLKILGKEA